MKLHHFASIALFAGLAMPGLAQSFILDSGNSGGMVVPDGGVTYFDLDVINPLTISGLEFSFLSAPGPVSVQIWQRTGTWYDFEGATAGWTLASTGTVQGPVSGSSDTFVQLDSPIPMGTGLQSLMIQHNGTELGISDGLFPLFRVLEQDSNLVWYEGGEGSDGPFQPRTGAPRVFPGAIHYELGATVPIGTNYCTARPNSTGQQAGLFGLGSTLVGANDVILVGENLPPNQFGLLITSRNQGLTFNPGGSQGDLCLDMPIGRFNSLVMNSGPGGQFIFNVDITQIPDGSSTVAVMPGETWNFQAWYRDMNPNPTSNFTNGLEITFQ